MYLLNKSICFPFSNLLCSCCFSLLPQTSTVFPALFQLYHNAKICKEHAQAHVHACHPSPRVGISGTTAKSCKRKFVHSSHPGPFAVVASSPKSQTKVGSLACFDFLYQNELFM